MQAATGLEIEVSDVSGQRVFRASGVPTAATIGELVNRLLVKMNLARNDVEGRPLSYYARLEREGRHLQSSEIVGESLEEGDQITLTPNIEAGGRRRPL